ncbi:MAG: glutamate-5-semialdehyde dehydrogenase [Desulfomonilaceae bacterium]
MSIKEETLNTVKATHEAAADAAGLSMSMKASILGEVAKRIKAQKEKLQAENSKDIESAKKAGLSNAMIDRLTLSDKVIAQTVEGLEEIAAFPDPVGEITGMWIRPNGMRVGKMRIPLGVIGIIYESRPNVTVDAAALCLKAGNSVILRGGSEAFNSNMALVNIFKETLTDLGINTDIVNLIPTTDREAILHMLQLEDLIDLIIPRGGEELIRFVAKNSRIPVIKHYKGVCHLYVDEFADLEMAVRIAINGKTQRPGVCNALETMLVHQSIAREFLPKVSAEMKKAGVELRGCETSRKIVDRILPATEDDWYSEYLDLILAVKVVTNIDEAIRHIAKYGSLHTEAIVTKDYNASQKFLRDVNSSTVVVNASTRMSDGYVFGLGAEIGISTTKIHAYGPMGVKDLTTTKFIVLGEGQIRE